MSVSRQKLRHFLDGLSAKGECQKSEWQLASKGSRDGQVERTEDRLTHLWLTRRPAGWRQSGEMGGNSNDSAGRPVVRPVRSNSSLVDMQSERASGEGKRASEMPAIRSD